MVTSWKCAQCGLVNFASDAHCKRCGAAGASAGVSVPPPPTGIVLEDGYVLPPPPTFGGVWRDGSTLVMSKEAALPDRCVKCNAAANGLRLKRNLSWHYPVLYLLLLIAFLIYVIVAAVLSKRATVHIGLCAEHFQRRRRWLLIGWILLVGGLVGGIAGLASDYPMLGLLSLVIFLFSLVWLIVVARTVTVRRIDDRFVWLKGINRDYLAELPPLPSGF